MCALYLTGKYRILSYSAVSDVLFILIIQEFVCVGEKHISLYISYMCRGKTCFSLHFFPYM